LTTISRARVETHPPKGRIGRVESPLAGGEALVGEQHDLRAPRLPAALLLRLATALLRTRYSSASSIFTRLNGRIGTSYDGERHYVANLADAPHRRPTRPLFTQVRGRGIPRSSSNTNSWKSTCRMLHIPATMTQGQALLTFALNGGHHQRVPHSPPGWYQSTYPLRRKRPLAAYSQVVRSVTER
jgi:hypothetical protein